MNEIIHLLIYLVGFIVVLFLERDDSEDMSDTILIAVLWPIPVIIIILVSPFFIISALTKKL